MTLSGVHSISQLPKRWRNGTALQICTTLQDRSIGSEEKGRGADSGDVSRCTSTPTESRAFDVTAKYWQRAKQAHNFNMYLTFDILYSHESCPHFDISVLQYAATLQVWTHLTVLCVQHKKKMDNTTKGRQ